MSDSFVGLHPNPVNSYNFIRWYKAQNLSVPLTSPIAFPVLNHRYQQSFQWHDMPKAWLARLSQNVYCPLFVHDETYTFYFNSTQPLQESFYPIDNGQMLIGLVSGGSVVYNSSAFITKDSFGGGLYRILFKDFVIDSNIDPGFYRFILYSSQNNRIYFVSNMIEVLTADECSDSAVIEFGNPLDLWHYYYRTGTQTGWKNRLRVHVVEIPGENDIDIKQIFSENTGQVRNITSELKLATTLETQFFDKEAHTAFTCALDHTDKGSFSVNGKYYTNREKYNWNTKREFPLSKGSVVVYDGDASVARRGGEYVNPPGFFLPNRRVVTPTLTIDLDNKTIQEQQPVYTKVGNFVWSGVELPISIYLTSGEGDDDNDSFRVCPDCAQQQLQSNEIFNYDVKNVYRIRIGLTDSLLRTVETPVIILVLDVTAVILDISLFPNTIKENEPIGTGIGQLTTVGGSPPYFFQIVQGTADFQLTGDQLLSNKIFDYETKNQYFPLVQVRDADNNTFVKTLTVNVLDVDEGRDIDFNVSPTEVLEQQPPFVFSAVIGEGGTPPYTFSIIDIGNGDADSFELRPASTIANSIATTVVLDYESKTSYTWDMRMTDFAGLTLTKRITIRVLDILEGNLTDIFLVGNTIEENKVIGTKIGVLTAQGGIGAITFSLSSGVTENSEFSLSAASTQSANLRNAIVFDYEALSTDIRIVTVTATDATGSSITKAFPIQVLDVPEITDIRITNNHLCGDMPSGSVISKFLGIGGVLPYSYALVSGTGSTDNASFAIVDDEWQTNTALDYATKSDYSVRVRVTDSVSATLEKVFVFYVDEIIYIEETEVLDDVYVHGTVAKGGTSDPLESEYMSSTSHASETRLRVTWQKQPLPGAWIRADAYMKFNLIDVFDYLDDLLEAKLVLTRTDDTIDAWTDFNILVIQDIPNSWDEDTMTWNNRVVITSTNHGITARFEAVNGVSEFSIDVQGTVRNRAGGILSIVLRKQVVEYFGDGDQTPYEYFEIASKEHATVDGPKIKICRRNTDNPGIETHKYYSTQYSSQYA